MRESTFIYFFVSISKLKAKQNEWIGFCFDLIIFSGEFEIHFSQPQKPANNLHNYTFIYLPIMYQISKHSKALIELLEVT